MNAYVVLFLRLPFLAIANTAHIATWILSGVDLITQEKLNKIIEGLEKPDADILALPKYKLYLTGRPPVIDDAVFI